jgi:hypothetical protein
MLLGSLDLRPYIGSRFGIGADVKSVGIKRRNEASIYDSIV